MLQQLVEKSRTIRRFFQYENISENDLIDMVNAARLSPSPRNQQALKFIIINSREMNDKLYPLLGWAGALRDWNGPDEGEKPAAYIVILGDHSIIENGKPTYHEVSGGIAAQSIILCAGEMGIGACIIASVQRKNLRELISIDDHLEILLVIALGQPKEEVIIEEMPVNGSYSYWRDGEGVHHVPKRSIDEIIINKITDSIV
jgi:nitroreductase